MPRRDPDNALGNFLKDRRSKIDPASLGYSMKRRRTPGLRREEVALLADVSPAWYAWLEQGRGGAPSVDVLERLAQGLSLTAAEREHLFLLAQNRPPEVIAKEHESVGPEFQHLLDSLEFSPAAIRTPAWDVLASNRAARVVHTHDGRERYNIMEAFFHRLEVNDGSSQAEWLEVARAVVSQFRAEAFRSGYGARVKEVIEKLERSSDLFRQLWNDMEVELKGAFIKTMPLPDLGELKLAATTFSVDGYTGLKMVVFTPVTLTDRKIIRRLLKESPIR